MNMNMDTSHHLQQQQQQQHQQMMYAQMMADPNKSLQQQQMYQMAAVPQMYLTPPPSYLAPQQQPPQPPPPSLHTIDDQIGNLDSCISELAAVAQQQQQQQQMQTDAMYQSQAQQQQQQQYQSPNDSSQSPKESKSSKKSSSNGGSVKKSTSSSGSSNKQSKSLLNTPSKTRPDVNSMHDSLSQSPANSNKRRKKDPMAPKAPLNGYLVYFNEERVSMRQQHPNMSFGELTKVIAIKWKELAADEKQKYIAQAELNKERYVKEMDEYKQSDAYKQYLKENSAAKVKRNLSTSHEQQPVAVPVPTVPVPQHHMVQPPPQQQQQQHHMMMHQMPEQMMQNGMYHQAPPVPVPVPQQQAHMAYGNHWKTHMNGGGVAHMNGASSSSMAAQASSSVMASAAANPYEIPIYSDEFVEHNKARENEMRVLRKEIGELEAQNSLLNKHLDSMKQSICKMENECDQYKMSSEHYQKKLDVFRQTMLKCFAQLPLPQSPHDYPSMANIDEYVFKLHALLSTYQQQQHGDVAENGVNVNGANGNVNGENGCNGDVGVNGVNGADPNATRAFVTNIKSIMAKFDLTNSYVDC